MISVMLDEQERTTMLLALDMLEHYTEEQRQKAQKKGNAASVATMVEFERHIAALRAKLA